MFNRLLYILVILQLSSINFKLTFGQPQIGNNYDDICLTPSCIHAASRMLNNMDNSVSPCDDFYKYSCGNYIKSTQLSDDENSKSSFSETQNDLIKDLKIVINSPKLLNDTKAIKIAKDYYQSCLNRTAIERYGLSNIKRIIKNAGGWPVLDGYQWNETLFDWVETSQKLINAGYLVDSLFTINFDYDPGHKFKLNKIIHLGQPKLIIIKNALEYINFMYNTSSALGASSVNLFENLLDVYDFINKLSQISSNLTYNANNNKTYVKLSIEQLSKELIPIDWNKYISTVYASNDTIISNKLLVIVETPLYFKKLRLLLNETSKRTLANYIMWNIVLSSVRYLPDRVHIHLIKHFENFLNYEYYNNKDNECFDIVNDKFSDIMDIVYLTNCFDKNSKNNVTKMYGIIKNNFINTIKNIDWFDNITTDSVVEYIKKTSDDIAYPDKLIDDSMYSNFEINNTNYLQNSLNIASFKRKIEFKKYMNPNYYNYTLVKSYRDVNAHYGLRKNSIHILAGIMGHRFFNNDYPNYMNYGGIGFIISHELTHGFTYTNNYFDFEADFYKKDFIKSWSPKVNDTYHNKIKCFIQHYENYTIDDTNEKANGTTTLDDNIADIGGIALSYSTYQKWYNVHGSTEKKMPGFEKFTPQQMFWLSFANILCHKSRPERFFERRLSRSHSRPKHRVLGSLLNNYDFSKDFNCPVNSKMNPINKCTLW